MERASVKRSGWWVSRVGIGINILLILMIFTQGLRFYLAGYDIKIVMGMGGMFAMAVVSGVLQWRMARQNGFIRERGAKNS
jgi:hypothetical protein